MKVLQLRVFLAMGLGASALQHPRLAAAEPSGADKSLATQLFKEGRALVDQGHYAEGCRKLEESQRIDPGGGTLLNLANCHEKEGRTATAWAEFTEALGIAKRDDRASRIEFARAHIAQLESQLSRLIIQVPRAADVPDLEIRRDGSSIGRAAWGSGMPVDPGDHLIEASAPGKITWKQVVNLGPRADSRTLVVPALDNAPAPPIAAGSASAPPGATPALASLASPNSGPDLPTKGTPDSAQGEARGGPGAGAWVIFGVGVAAAGAGTYFGVRAMSEKKDADRNCPNDVCSSDGSRQNQQAIRFANFATAGFAVGVVGLGLGTYLLASGSSRAAPSSATPESFRTRAASATARPDAITVSNVGASIGNGTTELTITGRW